MTQKRILIIGPTGIIGSITLKLCLDHHDFSALFHAVKNQDAAIFCLGAYTAAVPDDFFRKITMKFTPSFANALYKKSPNQVSGIQNQYLNM